MPQTTARRPGPESTLEASREQLIEAGIAILLNTGTTLGLHGVNLRDVIDATGISRATAYRALASDIEPQTHLRNEVLHRVLSRHSRDDNHDVVQAALGAELAAQQANIASDSVAERTSAFRSLIRVGAEASFHNVAVSRERGTLSAAYGSLNSLAEDAPDWLAESLREGEDKLSYLFGDLYLRFTSLFGYQVKGHFHIEQFITAVSGSLEGMALRYRVSDHLLDVQRPTGTDGETQLWTLFGVALEGLVIQFFEPDNPADPVADLTRY